MKDKLLKRSNMEKKKILSKLNIDIKDYNNELERILENKLFSYDVKNLLLSMLYKIENAYKDYRTVKLEVPTKRNFIENIFRIIKEKCTKIILVKSGTPEGEKLEGMNSGSVEFLKHYNKMETNRTTS